MHNLKRILGLLVIGLSAIAGTTAYAVSGPGFHPFASSDAPYINYAVGAVYNSDTANYRQIVADMGEPGFTPVGGYYWSTTVSGTMAAGTSGLQCTLTARNIATGAATSTTTFWNVNGNFAQKVQQHVTSSGYFSFSVSCALPPGPSAPTAYIWTAGSMIASTNP